MTPRMNKSLTLLFAAAAAGGLAGCGQEAEEMEYTTDVVDQSGGELIVEDAGPEPQGAELPETPMTSVPADDPMPAPE